MSWTWLLIILAHLSCPLCFWDQEHHIEEKRAPNEDAAAATDAVTSEVTESKVRTEEQPQQEDLLQAVSTEAGSDEHGGVQNDFVKPAETEVKALWAFANMSVREWLYEFCEST